MDRIIANKGSRPDDEAWPTALAYWRTFRAEQFDGRMVDDVAVCVAAISSTIPKWRAAVRGDAAAAIGLVLPFDAPQKIGIKIDLTMTTLLNVAFANPAAALVLSHTLRRMPLDTHHRARLATSWLAHNLCLGRRAVVPNATRAGPPTNGDGS
ncbi:MAG: hypothetical protein E6R08_08460 [Nevskiaceae bacterium]|nr:MAG: hypothetical protein E6R08_08460 [Nevskiaceae bacterium]